MLKSNYQLYSFASFLAWFFIDPIYLFIFSVAEFLKLMSTCTRIRLSFFASSRSYIADLFICTRLYQFRPDSLNEDTVFRNVAFYVLF